jgi:pimeloyl-ACP methyl ester carboxylesterase
MALRPRNRTASAESAWYGTGDGPPVILIHGVGLNGDVWARQIEALAPSRRVIAYDTLGHGLSAPPPADAVLGDYVGQLFRLMDGLKLPRASLVGHSMGAMIAIAAAIEEPARIDRLVALNSVHDRSPAQRAAARERADLLDRGGAAITGEAALERWFGPIAEGTFAEQRAQVQSWLDAVDPTGYARAYRVFATSDAAYTNRLEELQCPALFMTGERDPHSTPAMSRAMATAAPHGQAIVLPGQRHMAAFAAPDLCNRIILDFLQAGTVPPDLVSIGNEQS